ncbi:response regulator [Mucilaginibacter sp. FT3.2]|uniref:response regulator n=1 Tax=Mucilaginibacter sp. FT3.2 TaxID=2723090 RepID=UPI00160A9C9F|nr:response regulator [Mucilaginibacter sp. FT3.2]MBB6231870.1 response regulator RpfG family c-di-GMP phosphodiesterase [Mucilaginibacter sp. FT3.2]
MTAERAPVNVCLIDDDPIYTFGFKKLINLKGFNSKVINFRDGEQAITWIKDRLNSPDLPDVIFLDINMPNTDGWEFMNEFAEIKSQLGKKITIYVLSSSINLNDIYRAKKNPDVEDYIFKPVNEYQLAEIINASQEDNNDSKIYKYRS